MTENTPEESVDPDGDPQNMHPRTDAGGEPTGPSDTRTVQEDPNDEDDPDADPGMMSPS